VPALFVGVSLALRYRGDPFKLPHPVSDLTNPDIIKLKGLLFLFLGLLASTLLIMEMPTFRHLALLSIAVWSFCRFYYFAFYVIEHYVDSKFRFAGLLDFARYLLKQRNLKP